MTTTMKITVGWRAARGVVCTLASAQQAQTVRVRGTIEKVDGNNLTLKTGDGEAEADARPAMRRSSPW